MTTLNARANAAYHARVEVEFGFDSQRDAYETGWEDGYKAARQEVGQEGIGGDESCSASGTGDDSALPQEGEQASGALLARLEAIQASRQTDAERFAVGLCIAALGEGAPPLLDREAVSEALFTKWLVLSELRIVAAPVQHCDAFADAVMELARPMPTREQIAETLHAHEKADPWNDAGCNDNAGGAYTSCRDRYLERADAVLALLNGAD